jgi:hypothetical protein
MAEKLKTLKEVSTATGISVSTVRKYLNEFADYIKTEKGARNTLMFSAEAIKQIKKVRDMYKERKSREEIVAKITGAKPAKKVEETVQHEEQAPMQIGEVEYDHQDPRFW